jgi:peroxin-19
MDDDNELDEILESALDEFDEEESLLHTTTTSTNTTTGTRHEISSSLSPTTAPLESFIHLDNSMSSAATTASPITRENKTMEETIDQPLELEKILDNLSSDEVNTIEKLAREMGDFIKRLEENSSSSDATVGSSSSSGAVRGGDSESTFQETIKKTMERLRENSKGMENLDDPNSETFEKLMDKIFKKSAGEMGENEEEDEESEEKMVGFLEKIMETLMSPDILQKPMQELREKYPEWLAKNKDKISAEEYQRIQSQYEYSRKICAVYENSKFPDCLPQLIELMKEMQAYGQPPDEIVSSLSSDAGGQGPLPNLPGLENLDPKNCHVQ